MNRRAIAAATAGLSAMGLVVAFTSSPATAAAPPGSLDPTFGSGGEVISNLGGSPTASVQQPNGDVVISINQGVTASVARFLPNGALDPSFGSGGVAKAATSGELALEASGKILIGGDVIAANGSDVFAVERLDANGEPDATFGNAGVAASSVAGSSDSVLAQADGKILIGGYRVVTGRPEKIFGLIVRFNANGTVDTTFGSGGHVELASNSVVDALGLDASGDIFALESFGKQFELTSSGQVDQSVTPATITHASKGGTRIFLSDDQSLAGEVVGTAKQSYKAELERFNPTGSLDSTFASPPFRYNGETGAVGKDSISEVVVAPNGKIIAVGQHHPGSTPAGVGPIGVERIDANGELDTTFGQGGGVTTKISEVNVADTAIVEADGDVLIAGIAATGSFENEHVVLLRYLG